MARKKFTYKDKYEKAIVSRRRRRRLNSWNMCVYLRNIVHLFKLLTIKYRAGEIIIYLHGFFWNN